MGRRARPVIGSPLALAGALPHPAVHQQIVARPSRPPPARTSEQNATGIAQADVARGPQGRQPWRMADNGPPDERTPDQPRTSGESARLPVQIALILLGLFIALLVLWWVWPLVTGG